MKKSSLPRLWNWGIPAYKDEQGKLTCPMARDCIEGCYASQGAYRWPVVKNAYEERLALARGPKADFVAEITKELDLHTVKTLRIHDSGDFFSKSYLNKWTAVANMRPDVKFYAYTKMISLFKNLDILPNNFITIYSYGGKQDHLIKPKVDRHSRVFISLEDLKRAKYANASRDDAVALGKNHKIGLIYHGAISKEWSA